MKDKLKIFIFIFFLLVLFFYQNILVYNKLIFKTILLSFVPSLLPCLIIINLLLELDVLTYVYNKTIKFGKYFYLLFLIFICMILGMPSMQILLNNQINKKILSEKEANKFIYSFGTISFPFIYGVCLVNIFDIKIAIFILLIYFFINLISLIFMDVKINHVKLNIDDYNLSKSFSSAILSSFKTIGLIVGCVIVFSLPLFFIEKIPSSIKYLLEGIFEFSFPSFIVSQSNNLYLYLIMIFLFMFPSLSVVFQSKLINNKLNIFKYLIIRFFLMLSAILLFFIFSVCYYTFL